MNKRSERGYTMVELLLVLLILGLLMTLIVPRFRGVRDRANDSKTQTAVEVGVRTAQSVFLSSGEAFPPDLRTRMQSSEPAVQLVDGPSFPAAVDQVSVERVSAARAVLRGSSRSGRRLTVAIDNVSITRSWEESPVTVTASQCSTGGSYSGPVINRIRNPSAEVDVSNTYTNGSAARDRVSTSRYVGGAAFRVMTFGTDGGLFTSNGADVPVVAGQPHTVVSAYVRGDVGGERVRIIFSNRNSSGSAIAGQEWYSSTVTLTTGWQRISMTCVPVAGAGFVAMKIVTPDADFKTFYVDGLMSYTGSNVVSYGDGSTPGWTWNGTAHASASTAPTPWN